MMWTMEQEEQTGEHNEARTRLTTENNEGFRKQERRRTKRIIRRNGLRRNKQEWRKMG